MSDTLDGDEGKQVPPNRDDLRALLVTVSLLRVGEAVAALFVTDERAQEFCGHCDFKDDRRVCPVDDQHRYVAREGCGWSNRNGVRLDQVTLLTIGFNGRVFPRSDLATLDAAIEERKTATAN